MKESIYHITYKSIEIYQDIWILKYPVMFPAIQPRIIYVTERYMRDKSIQFYAVDYNYQTGDSQQQVWRYRLAKRSLTLGKALGIPSILWVPSVPPENELEVYWETLDKTELSCKR